MSQCSLALFAARQLIRANDALSKGELAGYALAMRKARQCLGALQELRAPSEARAW